MRLLDLLGAPLKDVFGKVTELIDSFHTSGEEKLQAHAQLVQLQSALQAKILDADVEWAKTQRDVIVAEAASQSWLARSWRPLTMMFFVLIIGTITWTGGHINGQQLAPEFVMKILEIVQYGLSGYVVGRSAEKIIPVTAQAVATVLKKQ